MQEPRGSGQGEWVPPSTITPRARNQRSGAGARGLAAARILCEPCGIWALLFGIGAFAFIHLLLVGPHTGYLAQLSPGALVAAFGAFAAFGLFSVLFWGYFRFRPARA